MVVDQNICPVCGYSALGKPPYHDRGFGSGETCPSCGFQFNVTDVRDGWSVRDWRSRWVSGGMLWTSRILEPPRNWNPQNQLGRVRPR
jgi:hypothetical protein